MIDQILTTQESVFLQQYLVEMRMRAFSILLVYTLFFISCKKDGPSHSGLEKYIPRKAAVVVVSKDIKNLSTSLRNNDFITQFQETELYSSISKQSSFLSKIAPDGETLICFTKLGRDDYEISTITRIHSQLFKGDSLLLKEAFLKEKRIKSLDTATHYLVYDNTFIASSSRLLLENIIREDASGLEDDTLFNRAYTSASSNATATIFVRGTEGASLFQKIFPKAIHNALEDAFSWVAADVDFSSNDIRLNGVVLVQDSTELKLNVLNKTAPVPNRIDEITPVSAIELTAVTYRDWEDFKESKANYLQIDPEKMIVADSDLFSTFTEVGLITLTASSAVVGISADLSMTQDALVTSEKIGAYRNIAIYSYGDKSAFAKAYRPLLNLPPVNFYTQLDDIFIFAEKRETLEILIANYQNSTVLSKNDIFKHTKNELSDASSVLTIKNIQSGFYKKEVSEKTQKILKDTSLEGYFYAATQLVQEDGYMLYNTVILKNDEQTNATGISQIANVKLNTAISTSPQLVKNHRTNGMDIVVQDVNNTLYLISNSGKVLWQKEIDGHILGKIQQVDLYRNGRLQLAFTTPTSFYILDRNGKDVSPYPLSFKDEITQPLAIFDYDKNRKYRFVIIQNDKILMYNSQAKAVTGFTFTKALAPVIFPPQHIRMGNKDYIVIAENTGNLNILSRTGKSRISVEKTIDFGNVPVFKNGKVFQTYDINGNKITVNTSGKVSESISDFSSDSKIEVLGFDVAGIRENELVIGKKKIKIPFGTYAKPTVVTLGNKKYTAITNTEANEVTLYNGNGTELPNFPVYGISKVDVGFLERNKSLGFVVQGDANSILIYRVNK